MPRPISSSRSAARSFRTTSARSTAFSEADTPEGSQLNSWSTVLEHPDAGWTQWLPSSAIAAGPLDLCFRDASSRIGNGGIAAGDAAAGGDAKDTDSGPSGQDAGKDGAELGWIAFALTFGAVRSTRPRATGKPPALRKGAQDAAAADTHRG
jgi:hypothetical protein